MAGAVLTLRGRCAARTVPESSEIEGRGDAVIVGRSRKDADVCLDLPPPTRRSFACCRLMRHAGLGGGAWVLSDLGSLNGVTLNETRLKAGVERPLSDGDVIRFGGAGLPGGPGDAGELRLGECATYVFQTSSKRPRGDDDGARAPEPATESQESRKRPRRRRAGSDENLVGGVSSPHSPKRLPSPRRIAAPENASNDDALKAAAACFDAVSRDRDALTAAVRSFRRLDKLGASPWSWKTVKLWSLPRFAGRPQAMKVKLHGGSGKGEQQGREKLGARPQGGRAVKSG